MSQFIKIAQNIPMKMEILRGRGVVGGGWRGEGFDWTPRTPSESAPVKDQPEYLLHCVIPSEGSVHSYTFVF